MMRAVERLRRFVGHGRFRRGTGRNNPDSVERSEAVGHADDATGSGTTAAAEPKEAKSVAVITMAYNETVFLPIWLRYYGAQLGAENLFVVDHGSDEGVLDCLPKGANLFHLPRSEADELLRVKFVTDLANSMLHYFDCVIYTDADEILVADPARYENLAAYCRTCAPIVAPVGLGLLHAIDREAPIDLARPVTAQRSFCQFQSVMSKPLIRKEATTWCTGFHFTSDQPAYVDDAYLFHLKAMDMDVSLQRQQLTRTMPWAQSNLVQHLSRHQRRSDEEHVERYFRKPTRAIKRGGGAAFDFTADVERVRAATQLDLGFYRHKWFETKVALIPERIKGMF